MKCSHRAALRGPQLLAGLSAILFLSAMSLSLAPAAVPKPPPELPDGHGVPSHRGLAEECPDSARSHVIQFRSQVNLHLNAKGDAHWLVDHVTNRITYSWGPMSSEKMEELGLLDALEEDTQKYLGKEDRFAFARHRLSHLVSRSKPLAKLGLDLVPLVQWSKPDDSTLLSNLRARRAELIAMGLEEEMRAAVAHLTQHDPDLPPETDLEIVAAGKAIPAALENDKLWGPVNDGLQAAAVMPARIEEGKTVPVQLVLRNAGKEDLYLALSERAGYDYAKVRDAQGRPVAAHRPHVFPQVVVSMLRPEINPGDSRVFPPLTSLKKYVLQPGATLQLATKRPCPSLLRRASGTERRSGISCFGLRRRRKSRPPP